MLQDYLYSVKPLPLVFFSGCLLLVLTLFFTVLLNKILLKFATNLGVRDKDQIQVRWSPASKPSLGGVAFFVFFLFSLLIYLSLFYSLSFVRIEYLCFVLVCSIAFLMGLADDAYNTRPWLKFAVQFFCAGIFIISGNYIKTFPWEWLNYTVTIIWVTGLMNSINMLDNMDGITTSVSWGILFTVIGLNVFTTNPSWFYLFMSLGVIGSLSGFFYHNWYPSKMFMGDSGSQFLGVFLAWLGVKFFWNGTDYFGVPVQAKQILMAGMLFIGPIADTTTVTINRIMRGMSPFTGGKDHTTHALVYNGWAQRHVAFFYLFITLLSGTLVFTGIHLNAAWNHWYTAAGSVYILAVMVSLFLTTKTRAFRNNFRA
ncbi:MAG: MraY family glycosyltransferase [Flavobacteriales bacterium]